MCTLAALRCFPRRSVICLFFVCITFFACAFYSFSVDTSGNLTPYRLEDTQESQTEVDAKPPTLVVYNSKLQTKADEEPPVHNSRHQNELDATFAVYSPRPQMKEVTNPDPAVGLITTTPMIYNLSNSSKPNGLRHISRTEHVHDVKTKYIYLVNTSSSTSSVSTSTSASVNKDNEDTCHLTLKDPKLILLWTSFFGYWEYLPKSHFRQCSRCRNCQVTKDRSKLLESDAVIFHARDISIADMPPVRLPHQKWVFYCLESPPYSDFPGLQYTQNMFNWTMTYRADSDILATYGAVHKVRPPRKLDLQALEWSWSNKTKSVAWMSSHCPTHGGRDLFALELKKYIDVDIYGTCGTHVCAPGEADKCYHEFSQKYKFFLAFENTLCKDYITEKFYRTFRYNMVPVVFGGANYSKFAPPGSFIDALSFKSPKHLAFFLAGVGKNFKLYSSFFKWRKDYSVDMANKKECQLCSLLHKKDQKPSSYENLRDWWVQGSHCKVWKPKR